jgi:carboxyl-terminal processing protease
LSHDKKQDLQKNKNEIKRLLQSEIVAKYYYQKGKATNEMQDDEEVKETLKVLDDMAKYNKILSGN